MNTDWLVGFIEGEGYLVYCLIKDNQKHSK